MTRPALALAFALPLLSVAGCVAPSAPPPAAHVAVPAPRPAPPPIARPVETPVVPPDWREQDVAAGDWTYRADGRGSVATFAAPGAAPEFAVRCDRAAGRIRLARRGVAEAGAPLVIRTTSTLRRLPARAEAGTEPMLVAELAAGDPLLDAMGFSRGRIAVEGGPPRIVMPAWPELLRVIEDCR